MVYNDLLLCKICGVKMELGCETKHFRTHKISSASYYQQFYPRKDFFSGEMILFKSRDTYFSNDFNEKENLRKWLSTKGTQEQLDYCVNLLKERRARKGLVWTPCQTELRTIMCPSVNYLNTLSGGKYYELMASIGYENRFEALTSPIVGRAELGSKIVIDTREQFPLQFNDPVERRKLDVGDYCLDNPLLANDCFIERKSIADFHGTLGTGNDRFQREIMRAQDSGAYLVILVEGSMQATEARLYHGKTTGDFIFRRMRDLSQKYKSIQFLFVKNREESSRVTRILLGSDGAPRKYDLQMAYDTRLL